MQRSLVRHLDSQGTSLVEIMAMLTILGLAITAIFSTVTGGIYFASDSENRIKAINLAREGIEGVTNLRNTNWLRFSSDQKNCWKVIDYSANCIGGGGTTASISNGTYMLDNKNGAWYLSGISWPPVATDIGLRIDSQGHYTNSGSNINSGNRCNINKVTDCQSPFTRRIDISIPVGNTGSMEVTSIVSWTGKTAHTVTLTTTLTNWKSKF